MSGISTLVNQLIDYNNSIAMMAGMPDVSDDDVREMVKAYVYTNPGCRAKHVYAGTPINVTSWRVDQALRRLRKNNEIKAKIADGFVYFPWPKK